MSRRLMLWTALAAAAVLPLTVTTAGAAVASRHFVAGAPGVGDPYYPLEGNGGYDVRHYALKVRYQPDTSFLRGRARIFARATENLWRFNLDLQGLDVHSVVVDGRRAHWYRTDDHELVVTPKHRLVRGEHFTTVVRYSGVPRTQPDFSGFLPTDDGAVIAGEPEGAANWFPSNDHPSDKATFAFDVTVPRGTEVVANGRLVGKHSHGRTTTWHWREHEQMTTYLATATMGQFRVHAYKDGGIRFVDAVDPDLYLPPTTPRTGTQYVYSQRANSSYKRLTREVAVPATGGHLSFWVWRSTEPNWDFAFVEARTPGQDDWTTLPDTNGHTAQDTGFSCISGWLDLHPQLAHYETLDASGDSCTPTGTTGAWWAATGRGDGWENWDVDLSAWSGATVEVSLAYASDESVQGDGVFVDDVVTPTGAGSTSFEADADPLDGWAVSGAPPGSPGNDNDFVVTTPADVPTTGQVIDATFAREPETLAFLASNFGAYPWRDAGGIVDDLDGLGFALENQTRPIYSKDFFSDTVNGGFVVAHENAHQWYGDDVSVAQWKDIWLNEGFATYAEWLWSEHEGYGTPLEIFQSDYAAIPADDDFWTVPPADPGVDELFGGAVYERGAMTLEALRLTVGDDDFFRILRTWHRRHAGGNGSTPQFIRLAERISHQDLSTLFHDWLYTTNKPPAPPVPSGGAAARAAVKPWWEVPALRSERARFGY